MCVSVYVCMRACVCVYVCLSVGLSVCMHACIYMYAYECMGTEAVVTSHAGGWTQGTGENLRARQGVGAVVAFCSRGWKQSWFGHGSSGDPM